MIPLLLSFSLVFIAQERPDPAALIEQARALLPRYEGEAREFLTEEMRRDVVAADHLFQAALALQAESAYALWWGGHARVLLAENARNRGWLDRAAEYGSGALAFFDRAIELDPTYHWAYYARANARSSSGALFAALEDFEEAVRLANAVIERVDASQAQDALLVRFKARQWGADTRMRIFEFEEARAEFRTFYAENGDNQWDLAYSLAESYQRERDFEGARNIYVGVLQAEAFQPFDSTYSQLAYLAGLQGETGVALSRLEETFQRERVPSLYPRLWTWMLARGESLEDKRATAWEELTEFLEAPPSDFPAWDATLGAFMVGASSEAEFALAAKAEIDRRSRDAVPLDGLACEAAFYRAHRLELDAADGGPDVREVLLERSLAAYAEAFAFDPVNFKWEWAYARLGYARVAGLLGRSEGGRFYLRGQPLGSTRAFRPVRAHRVGSQRSEALSSLSESSWHPGDLVQGYLLGAQGDRAAALLVYGVHQGLH